MSESVCVCVSECVCVCVCVCDLIRVSLLSPSVLFYSPSCFADEFSDYE